MKLRSALAFVIISVGLIQQSPTLADEISQVGGPVAAPTGPIIVDGRLVFPEGARVPRNLTDIERDYMERYPRVTPRAVTPPPVGPVRCASEYEPMDGILLSWEPFTPTTQIETILKSIALQITTNAAADGAKIYMVVDTTTERTTVQSALTSFGVNMSRVEFIVRTTDTIWIRDYGPRYIYIGDVRAVVDHDYNRPRPNDDLLPSYFASVKKHAYFEHQLVHGGGNYHLDANDNAYATELIEDENPGLTQPQIVDIWNDYQAVDTHIFPAFPTTVDLTQHIDMWMQVIADDKVVISDWPFNVGSAQDVICDNAAVEMENRGYTVHRVPARLVSGVHYTYTNVIMCNDLVLVPSYTNATVSPSNATALAAWQAALPGKTFVQINSQAIVTAAGVLHCICMHVPRHLGGVNPTAYLRTLRGGEVLTPSQMVDIRWYSDDDVATTNADILLSTDGGVTFDTILAAATADDGHYSWTVPDIYTTKARIRVLVRDALNKTGYDESEQNITINGTPLAGDLTCNVVVDISDLEPFVGALLDAGSFTECNLNAADMNGDTMIDAADIAEFTAALLGP